MHYRSPLGVANTPLAIIRIRRILDLALTGSQAISDYHTFGSSDDIIW